jgi:glycosyltransferase involved in cell wall biosynthesis
MTETAPAPRLMTLIVCTCGRVEPLSRLARSLAAQTSQAFEIVLVDQNPPEYLEGVLKEFPAAVPLTHIFSAPGLSRARNAGLERARGDIVAFPDDDCWYPPALIGDVLKLFRDRDDCAILTCATRDEAGRESNGVFLRKTQDVTRTNVWWAGNSNGIFVRRDVFDRTGGFNEELGAGSGTPYGSGEETDFLLRAIAADEKVRFVAGLHTHHPQVRTVLDAETRARIRSYARGYGRILMLNGYSPFYVFIRSLGNAASVLLALVRLDGRFAWYKCLWIAGTWKGYRSTIGKV